MKSENSITPIKTLPDEELFLLMSYRESDPDKASEAFGEFYNRYFPYLEELSKSVCRKKQFTDDSISEVVCHNTLIICYEEAGKFLAIADLPGEKDKTMKLKSWLGKLAENEYKQILKSQAFDFTKLSKPPEDQLDLLLNCLAAPEDDEGPPSNYMQDAYDEAYLSLTDDEREILEMYQVCKAEGVYHKGEIIEKLAIQMGIRPDSVRRRYHRAINKIQEKLLLIKIHDNYETDRRNNERRNL